MSLEFFRPRDRFDFSKNALDIGKPFLWNRDSFLKHFFLRVFAIAPDRWEEFYYYHRNYYLETHPEGNEEAFFTVLWDLIATRLHTLNEKDIYTSKSHIRDQKEIKHLKSFTAFLISIDKWNSHETDKEIIMRLQNEINALRNKFNKQSEELKAFKLLETTDQINIPKGYLLTLVDIFLELQKLEVSAKKELLFSRTQAIWMKLICKYFTEAHEPINYDRLKRYFSPDPNNPSNVKHAEVPDNKKLFKIIPANKRS